MNDLEVVQRHLASATDRLGTLVVAMKGLLGVEEPEAADTFAMAQTTVDVHEFALAEQEWARQTAPGLNDPNARDLMTGWRMKMLELEGGCIALANGTDVRRPWVVAVEILEQRNDLPY